MRKNIIWLLVLIIATSLIFSGCDKQNSFSQEDIMDVTFSKCEDLELIKELVEEDGYDVNSTIFNREISKDVSLLYQIQTMDYKPRFAEYLLEQGADPDFAHDDLSMLMALAGPEFGAGGIRYGKLLIEHGADINIVDEDKKSALDYAVENSYTEFINLLIKNNANVTNKTFNYLEKSSDFEPDSLYIIPNQLFNAAKKQGLKYDGDTVFQNACLGNTSIIVDDITNGKVDMDSELPFYIVAFCGQKALSALIENGFDEKKLDSAESDILWIAASTGNLENVKYIVENELTGEFSQYYTDMPNPLKVAILNDHYDVSEFLLSAGLEFRINDETGYDGPSGDSGGRDGLIPTNSIEGAAQNGNVKMLELLKKYNYPLNANTYYMGIRMAIINNQYEMLAYLLDTNVDLNYVAENKTGEKLLEVCGTEGSEKSLRLLLEKDSGIIKTKSDALIYAIDSGNYPVARYMLEQGANINDSTDYNGETGATPWSAAKHNGYFDIVKLLVENGADINNRHVAFIVDAASGSNSILNYLIEKGADVNLHDYDGYTPLMMAAMYHREQNVRDLLKAGADPSIKDSEGKIALDYAKDSKDKEIIKLLENAQ